MASRPPAPQGEVPPLETWRNVLRPQGLADRLHAAVVSALGIAARAGYRVLLPDGKRPRFDIEQIPSEDWALPRRVQEAVQLLDLANEIVPMLASDPPSPQAALIERAFTAGELSTSIARS